MEAARDQVTVAIDGKRRKISKAQAAAIHLANAGATGNEKLLLKFIDVIADIEARAEDRRRGVVRPHAPRQPDLPNILLAIPIK